jgi:hypothetical protein
MSDTTITRDKAFDLIQNTAGKIFSALFDKKDGTERKMVARLNVEKHKKGGELGYDPSEHNLVPVFDMQKQGYRMIPVDRLKRVRVNGEEFEVVNDE